MSTIVDVDKNIRPIRRSAPRIEALRLEDVKDPKRLVRAYNALLELVLKLAENDPLEYVEYEDVPISGAQSFRFRHGYKGRVRFWVTQWKATSTASNYVPLLMESSSTDEETLVLDNVTVGALGAFAGKITLRVQRSSV